jgi:hypothetical protein
MYSTPGDLKNACLETLSLAARLQTVGDTITVICTANPNSSKEEEDSPGCYVLYSLQPPDLRKLAKKLKELPKQSSTKSPNFRASLLRASQGMCALDGLPGDIISDIRTDIIVISPTMMDLAAFAHEIDPSFRIHLFNPGVVPYNDIPLRKYVSRRAVPYIKSQQETADCWSQFSEPNVKIGWVLDAAQCISGECRKHKSHSLRDIIIHSRAQAHSGAITGLSVSLHSRPDAVIEKILGNLQYPFIHPGQTASLMVKVKLQPLSPPASRGQSSTLSADLSTFSFSETISNLEISLGEYLSELFDVKVCYYHSLFPGNTQLVAQETCWLRRVTSSRLEETGEIGSRFSTSVQKQLALCITSTEVPEEALESLEDLSTSGRATSSCLKIIEALRETLNQRLELSTNGIESGTGEITEILAYSWLSVLALSSSDPAQLNVEAQERTDFDRQRKPSPETPATVIRRRVVKTSDLDIMNEEARKNWKHIRKTSKPENEIAPKRNASEDRTEQCELHIEQIKRTVQKNQRRMSMDTLRSLARDIRHVSDSTERTGFDNGNGLGI